MSIDTFPSRETSLTVPLSIANGGTGGDDAAEARSNLGCGTMATQNANAVAMTGGSATGLTDLGAYHIGAGVAPAGTHALSVNGAVQMFGGAMVHSDAITAAFLNSTAGGSILLNNLAINTAIVGYIRCMLSYAKGTEFGLVITPTGSDAGATNPVTFNNVAGTGVGSIGTTATATSFNTSSDARLKHAIEKLVGSLDLLRVLNPVSFLWNANDEQGEGFLAHELQQSIPAAVTGKPDALNDDGSINPQGVDYSKLVPRLVGAIQELLVRVEALEARLA